MNALTATHASSITPSQSLEQLVAIDTADGCWFQIAPAPTWT